ncbi:MAG: hypothetical protein VZS44_06810 [Bacilli bacterium]|nr:hypothetical protein [Bacilli bacterium]
MYKELYALLRLYQDKELDDEFINKAFDIMMKYENLDNYINDIILVDDINNSLGSYHNEDHIIKINKNKINNEELILNKKLVVLQVLRYGFEHAKNLQRIYERNNDIETKVVRYSLIEYAIKHNLYYGFGLDKVDPLLLRTNYIMNYDIDPAGRIVGIKSWKFMVNLLKNQRCTNDLLMARSMLYYSYIKGYKDNGFYLEAPTYNYLLMSGLYHEYYLLKKQFDKSKYSLDTRLLCGLPISYEEYNESTLAKARLRKK